MFNQSFDDLFSSALQIAINVLNDCLQAEDRLWWTVDGGAGKTRFAKQTEWLTMSDRDRLSMPPSIA